MPDTTPAQRLTRRALWRWITLWLAVSALFAVMEYAPGWVA